MNVLFVLVIVGITGPSVQRIACLTVPCPSYKYRLLNLYCETFDTSSYGERHTSLLVCLRHMNKC